MVDISQSTEIPPATTEISLTNGNDSPAPPNGEYGDSKPSSENGDKSASMSPGSNPLPNTPIGGGGQSYHGSTSVGSRLAGEDIVGRRINKKKITTHTQSLNDPHQSPVFKGGQTIGNSNSMGFGNSLDTTNNTNKMSNLTLQEVQQVAAVKAENLKTWSVKTYRCTKQLLSEKLGRGTKTVDLELEAKIEILRDTKRKYENLLVLSRALANHFSSVVQTQKVLGEAFSQLSGKSQELQDEFRYNAETQHVLAKNGEALLAAINFFSSGINTLCSKTMEDTLLTVKRYEAARVEFDAYRSELEVLKLAPRTEANILKQANAQANYNNNKAVYDKLRADVGVKIQFLDENRMKVMQKQLQLFHNAVTAYFAGNQQELESTLKQFNVKHTSEDKPSWLESQT
uniref:Arfaptin-2-like n=1 Tax=Phallusia mammillata TaxID=59560 RepID=A0A6F9D774_9ASCI|nr:arfaptin-2-like [Phallusia mammillata]